MIYQATNHSLSMGAIVLAFGLVAPTILEGLGKLAVGVIRGGAPEPRVSRGLPIEMLAFIEDREPRVGAASALPLRCDLPLLQAEPFQPGRDAR